jgi:2-alkenal reductase
MRQDRFWRWLGLWVTTLLTLVVGNMVWREVSVSIGRPRVIAPREDLSASERATVALFERAAPSVAYLFTEDAPSRLAGNRPGGAGSGIVWDEAGHIVTNYHVVEGATRVRVRLDSGEAIDAKVVGASPDHDLAVVRLVEVRQRLFPVPIGSSSDLKVGQSIFAIGNPFGLSRTLTRGIISALDRRLPTASGREIAGAIQTDAAINPGNSGGPLLDSSGRLVGVTTAILSASGSSAGVGFAVPVDVVNRVVPILIRDGRVPRPGIGVAAAPEELAARYGVSGLIVAGIQPGSPAQEVGLKPLDRATGRLGDIITHVENRPIASIADLALALEARGIGKLVSLSVLRDGRVRTVDVRITDIGLE